ncbi:MAG: SprT family zinc-dependent metalloprotease [Legionellaceae bacterium]|nr:SprT family zinc-dependent metalloprotease [Legionellaceae bacterium]
MLIEMDGLTAKLSRKRIKNINVRIQRSGDVHVSAPMKLPLDFVYRFLQDKREWIDGHRQKIQAQTPALPKTLQTGDMLFFLGQAYIVMLHETAKQNRIEHDHSMLHFFVKMDTSVAKKQVLLNRWYHVQMQERLPELFAKWEAIIGVQARTHTIKLMKTRWGSCQPIKKHICLNLRLIQKPLICLEYVIVHELVHLLEASHNKRFYALMSQFMPEWKSVKMRLESIHAAQI